MNYVDANLAFDTKPENPAWDELVSTLGLNDPAVRAALSQQTGLDFENDPFAPLKLALDCADAQHLSLKGARADVCGRSRAVPRHRRDGRQDRGH